MVTIKITVFWDTDFQRIVLPPSLGYIIMMVKAAGTSVIMVHLHHIPDDSNCQINDQFPPVPFISRNNIHASFYYFLSYSQKHQISEQNY
jgi:hypothetical protein